jgi:hypothetical protein
MKKYFIVSDNESQMGVFEYTTNQEADSLIMQIVCDHYWADDCELNEGFKIEEYNFKSLKITGAYKDEENDNIDFDVYIDQIGFYSKEETKKFDYVILTNSNMWVSSGNRETQEQLDVEIKMMLEEHPDESLVVVTSDKMEFFTIN